MAKRRVHEIAKEQGISSKEERAKQDGLTDHYRKYGDIHRIANPPIESLNDQAFA